MVQKIGQGDEYDKWGLRIHTVPEFSRTHRGLLNCAVFSLLADANRNGGETNTGRGESHPHQEHPPGPRGTSLH